jgi:cation transport ATPase
VTTTRNETTRLESVEVETEHIMRTGSLWLAMVVIAAALVLGPSFAAGWRPALLSGPPEAAWWLGVVTASFGTALLVWAGCPVLGFALAEAHRQKVFSIRVGIVLSLSGFVFAGGIALLAPIA